MATFDDFQRKKHELNSLLVDVRTVSGGGDATRNSWRAHVLFTSAVVASDRRERDKVCGEFGWGGTSEFAHTRSICLLLLL